MLDRSRYQLRVTRSTPSRQRAIPRHGGKITALNIFHREVVLTFMFARFIDCDNVWVPQVGRRLRLRTKAKHFLSACELTRENQLERNHAVQAALTRLKNHTHSSPRNFLDDLVIAELRAAEQRRFAFVT